MKNLTGKFTGVAAAVILLLGLFILVNPANAQTRKKKTIKKKTTASIPQPVRQSTLPVVISQADQYQNQNQQIITGAIETPTEETQVETLPETFDEKLNKMTTRMKEMSTRVKTLESSKQNEYDEKQRRLLLNLDILTRAEQRAESLRKQLFELVEKENSIKTKLETIDYDIRPEMIERQVAFAGTLRPEELREMRKKNLEAEKRNMENLLIQIQATKTNLEQNVQKADLMVEKLRAVLEKDIDDTLNEKTKEQ